MSTATIPCEICGKVGNAKTGHPCSFERGCSCWRGKPCRGKLKTLDQITETIIEITQRRLDNV